VLLVIASFVVINGAWGCVLQKSGGGIPLQLFMYTIYGFFVTFLGAGGQMPADVAVSWFPTFVHLQATPWVLSVSFMAATLLPAFAERPDEFGQKVATAFIVAYLVTSVVMYWKEWGTREVEDVVYSGAPLTFVSPPAPALFLRKWLMHYCGVCKMPGQEYYDELERKKEEAATRKKLLEWQKKQDALDLAEVKSEEKDGL
jgi:hypothetical protein